MALVDAPDASATMQPWHAYEESYKGWTPHFYSDPSPASSRSSSGMGTDCPSLSIFTWNVDAFGELAGQRMSSILKIIENTRPGPVDIIFLQEVSPTARNVILHDKWVTKNWYVSGADTLTWHDQPYSLIILLSKRTFGREPSSNGAAVNTGVNPVNPVNTVNTGVSTVNPVNTVNTGVNTVNTGVNPVNTVNTGVNTAVNTAVNYIPPNVNSSPVDFSNTHPVNVDLRNGDYNMGFNYVDFSIDNMNNYTFSSNSFSNPLLNTPLINNPVVNNPVVNTPVGNAAVGNAAVGNTPFGNAPFNAPYGNAPFVNAPFGNAPFVNAPFGNAPLFNYAPANTPLVSSPLANPPLVNNPVVNTPVVNYPVGNNPLISNPLANGACANDIYANRTFIHNPLAHTHVVSPLANNNVNNGGFGNNAPRHNAPGHNAPGHNAPGHNAPSSSTANDNDQTTPFIVGNCWRVEFPSHFHRDALVWDVYRREPHGGVGTAVRLINVHLDSMKMNPNHRPRQLNLASSLLFRAGCGVIAGDFNPILPEDDSLVQDCFLIDAWSTVRPGENGYTWGVVGRQAYPAKRMDKVTMVGLRPQRITPIHPGNLPNHLTNKVVPWSDHSGLWCHFDVTGP